jgi:hypothetical protein
MVQTKRIEVGGQMATHAIGADQHDRAQRIAGSFFDGGFADRRAGLFRRGLDPFPQRSGVERAGQLVLCCAAYLRPVASLPARSGLRPVLCWVGKKILAFATHGFTYFRTNAFKHRWGLLWRLVPKEPLALGRIGRHIAVF